MSITVSLHHKTTYAYDRPVILAPHIVRLRPAPHCRTPILAYSLKVLPQQHFLNWQQDPFGNYQAHLVFPRESAALEIEVDLIAELTAINPFDFFVDEHAQKYPFAYDEEQQIALAPYLHLAPSGARLEALAAVAKERFARPGRRTIDVLVDVNRHIKDLLRYEVRMEPGVFSPDDTLERGHGSCRDFAWVLVQLVRRLGLAARFASGYSIQLKADTLALDGPQGVAEDVTDLHAWAEVFLPGAGWIGFDATSGLMCAEGHLPLACTADPTSASPVAGSFTPTKRDGGRAGRADEDDEVEGTFSVQMRVERTREQPRVTKPYSEETWTSIDTLGRKVDALLDAGDVRLSMGGEPTFVSIDDPDGAEWNTAALGPNKRRLAGELFQKLHARFAPGGLLHFGQGKWYPGEPLPRWALTCYFRKDDQPLWRRPELVAMEGAPPPAATAPRALMRALAQLLGVDPRQVIPAYEDAFYYAWRERRLPVNVSASDARLDDPQERARLGRIFEQGLAAVAGYILPLEYADSPAGGTPWRTGPWALRSERLFLVPGDSPLGLRLPLDTLPWIAPEARTVIHEPDPFAPRAALPMNDADVDAEPTLNPWSLPPAAMAPPPPSPSPSSPAAGSAAAADGLAPGAPGGAAAGHSGAPIRTALCVEVRDGLLHIFLPPVASVEAYLELVAAIEQAARVVGCPVRIEGYPPPRDPRIGQFAVTPDPGVIEVNIQPALSWNELCANTHAVYEDARTTRLGTEKFLLDGRHTGTGGGNHLVLGGPTPADSPLLRRPDLLRSLVGYFINHPALSYMFSGLFVGPTSQAPRIDEARQESVDELEIAFQQIDAGALAGGPAPPPWLVDRIFRHLLTDITGNTHRAELCIDKLFSPDSASGRQGLLELRSFEMPPHPRMSLVQQLLLRALVAKFWQTPYRQRPVRWGTALHDRFMLPHFIAEDLDDVLEDLRQAGFAFRDEWFAPHFEFRFPLCGRITAAGIVLELRQAIEPWSVLGEEASGGGQARFVDSSLERLQVKVQGLFEDRYAITCNQRVVPLFPTGTNGESVAGVRYRAWQLSNALHPRIGVHVPLTFDLVDTWAGRSISGCTYHVAHPGGHAYDLRPRNALEAEARRSSRFFAIGHTPGVLPEDVLQASPRQAKGFPLTLDLRR
jgi:uncharacterized protein (DUF2126 family)/transglutaminase-like putative cysteine protease